MIRLKVVFIWLLVSKFSLAKSEQAGFESSECYIKKIEGADCAKGELRFPRRHKRSTADEFEVEILAFGKKIRLLLTESDSVLFGATTPVYRLSNADDMMIYRTDNDDMNVYAQKKTFEDMINSASLTLEIQPDGTQTVQSGYIGSENLFFTSNPQSATYQFYQFKNDNNNYYFRNDNYQTSYTYTNPLNFFSYPYGNIHQYNRQGVQIPEVIYLEILVIVDYQLFIDVGEDKILLYLLHYWNQVDMLFRKLNNPQFKLNIAGIVMPMEENTLTYLYDNSYYVYNYKIIDLEYSLNSFKKWLYHHDHIIPINSYDMAITMTSRKPDSQIYPQRFSYKSEIGRSFTSSACKIDHYQQEVTKIGIVTNCGNYMDVITAAHELGHILGASHDEGKCPTSVSNIMAASVNPGNNHPEWSQCSMRAFGDFLRTNPTCLYNKPNV